MTQAQFLTPDWPDAPANIGAIATLRGGTKSHLREQLHVLEAKKQAKWDAIRTLWAGDGQFHKRMTGGAIPSRAAE